MDLRLAIYPWIFLISLILGSGHLWAKSNACADLVQSFYGHAPGLSKVKGVDFEKFTLSQSQYSRDFNADPESFMANVKLPNSAEELLALVNVIREASAGRSIQDLPYKVAKGMFHRARQVVRKSHQERTFFRTGLKNTFHLAF